MYRTETVVNNGLPLDSCPTNRFDFNTYVLAFAVPFYWYVWNEQLDRDKAKDGVGKRECFYN